MILILTSSNFEQCTAPVIDWLLYYNANFLVMTYEDIYKKTNLKFDVTNECVYVKNIELTKEIKSIYYRRFEDSLNLNLRNVFPTNQARNELNEEIRHLAMYLFYLLRDKKWFPNFQNVDIDKLTALSIAKKNGLSIPETIVTTSIKDASSFVQTHKTIIKPICFSGYYIDGGNTYSQYTTSVDMNILRERQQEYCFPTLFQRKIEKDFEIRVFYLDEEIYASAILVNDTSYDDVKTEFEKGHLNWEPYQLPTHVQNKLKLFMHDLRLNTASIDLIKDRNGNFVFIDLNPLGQFIAPSIRCNYNLDQKIAKWLIANDN